MKGVGKATKEVGSARAVKSNVKVREGMRTKGKAKGQEADVQKAMSKDKHKISNKFTTER